MDEINFDEASKEWRRNKLYNKYGFERYCCGFIKTNGEPCKGVPKIWSKSLRLKNEKFVKRPGLCNNHYIKN